MTTQDRDYEDILRSALCAAAESIEPLGDGLQKIRHRLDSRRPVRFLAGFTDWLLLYRVRLGVRLEPVTEAGRAALGQLGGSSGASAAGRGTPGRQHARRRAPHGWLRAAHPWMRPVLAVSAVVAVVVVSFVTLHTVQQQAPFAPANSVSAPGGHHAGAHPGTTAYAPGSGPLYGASQSPEPTGTTRRGGAAGAAPLATCSATPRPKASKAGPSSSPSGTPTPTPGPSGSSSGTPTPTPADSTPPANPTPTGSPAWSPGSGNGGAARAGTGITATTTSIMLAPAQAGTACGRTPSATPKASTSTPKTSTPKTSTPTPETSKLPASGT